MIHRPNTRGQPQTIRRMHRDLGVQNDRSRANIVAGEAMLGAKAGVRATTQVAEFRARQGGGHRNLAARRHAGVGHKTAAIRVHAHVPGVQVVGLGQVFGQRHQSHFDGVNHRAAANADDQIGLAAAQLRGQGQNSVARGVFHTFIKQTHHLLLNARQSPCDGIGLAVERAAGDDKNPVCLARLGFCQQRFVSGNAKTHAILFQKFEDAGVHVVPCQMQVHGPACPWPYFTQLTQLRCAKPASPGGRRRKTQIAN